MAAIPAVLILIGAFALACAVALSLSEAIHQLFEWKARRRG